MSWASGGGRRLRAVRRFVASDQTATLEGVGDDLLIRQFDFDEPSEREAGSAEELGAGWEEIDKGPLDF
jgi:hypothetical protein